MPNKMLLKTIDGTAGDDSIVGTSEDDVINARAGNDTVLAGSGGDQVDGGDGDDILYGEAGNDRLYGGLGTDTLIGGLGDDNLGGRSVASEASSADRLYGGLGDDYYAIDHVGDIVFENSGEGIDQAVVSIDGGGWYAHANIERLWVDPTSQNVSFIVGNALDNHMRGEGANDMLLGGGGKDTIIGQGGDDSLFGEAGDDDLDGGDGIDYLLGGSGNDRLAGRAGADALYGEDGDDYLHGGDDFATDILVGGAGNDTLVGQSRLGDYDLMDGGAGDDAYWVDTPADLTFEAADGGIDTVYADIKGTGYYLYANTENLYLRGETTFGVGNELDNVIVANSEFMRSLVTLLGGEGNDILSTTSGVVALYGEDGDDKLYGSSHDDLLVGGNGADYLDGASGNDVLIGGAGADLFYFAQTSASTDYITDFEDGIDLIQLAGYTDFAALQPHISQVGADTLIEYAPGQFLVLQNVNMASLSGADFII